MRSFRWTVLACSLATFAAACGGDDGGGSPSNAGAGSGGPSSTFRRSSSSGGSDSGSGASGGSDTSSGSGGTSSGGTSSGGTTSGGGVADICIEGELAERLGKNRVMIGASMADETASAAPFDVRYLYLAGGLFDGDAPCESCANSCTAGGVDCANSGPGCVWWGCWQYDQVPPGAYVRDFVEKAKGDGQIPMITYYQMLQASGATEGAGEVEAANDVTLMTRYFADFRFVVQQIGMEKAIIHVEPDFWGFAQQLNSDPHAIPAAVASANPTDCGDQENSIAGLGRCLIAIVHEYAPNAVVGLHASPWGTNMDVFLNSDPNFDVEGEAEKLGAFMRECAPDADLVIVDAADRDAGYYASIGQDRFWDDTNATLPNFAQALAWSKALGESTGKKIGWWQLPVGNMELENKALAWHDNRVDYFMTHVDEVARAHGVFLAFGAGDGGQTTPETDGGNLIAKVKAYAAAADELDCP
jgi:hypothetical protein